MHRLDIRFKRGFCTMIFMVLGIVFPAFGVTCTDPWSTLSGYSDSCICGNSTADPCSVDFDGSTIGGSKFEITTISTTSSFSFYLSARGNFYIDWGDGKIQYIERTGTTNTSYSHTYSSAGTYVIRFGGGGVYDATTNPNGTQAYNTGNTGAISFSQNTNISTISGNLSKLLPTLSNGTQPKFYRSFYGCSNLVGSLPPTLFDGFTGSMVSGMFFQTFNGCTNLGKNSIGGTSTYYIPPNLFGNLTLNTSYMTNIFNNTGLLTTCPTGKTQKGVKLDRSKVLCECSTNEYTAAFDASACVACVTGSTVDRATTACECTNTDFYWEPNVCALDCPVAYPDYDSGATSKTECYFTDTQSCSIYGGSCPTYASCSYQNTSNNASCKVYNDGNDTTTCDYTDCGNTVTTCPTNSTLNIGGTACECDIGYNWNAGYTACTSTTTCTQCSDTDMNYLKFNNGLSIPVCGNKTTTPAINIQHGNTVCYIPLETGTAPANSLRINHNGTQYYAVGAQ